MGKIAYIVTETNGPGDLIFSEDQGVPSWMFNYPYYTVKKIVYFEVENTND
jgi:hypothetical protein